jgi:ABC-type molybdenum transport system ATPase subunit/photorepair protein PhrA
VRTFVVSSKLTAYGAVLLALILVGGATRGCAGHRTRGHCALSAMLTVSQLSKSFAGRALFDDVSLQVNRGDRIGLVGPNGAGKSTLFALLLGDASHVTLSSSRNAVSFSSVVTMNRLRLLQCTRTSPSILSNSSWMPSCTTVEAYD